MLKQGQKFNLLTVLRLSGRTKRRQKLWLCLCDCGKKIKSVEYELKTGHTKSCGCLKAKRIGNLNRTHGMSKSSEYEIWCGIIKRTENKNYYAFKDYGGRGIKISKRWRDSFKAFLKDMGPRPSIRHSIERTNNDGNYCKSNCKWSTLSEQARNKRNNIRIEHNGRIQILQDWANELGVTRSKFKYHIKNNPQYKIL